MTCNEDVRLLKNKLSLDFNQPKSTKKQKACQLTTPDLDKLALTTPQMAEYLKTISPVGPLTTFTRNINPDDDRQRILEMWSNQAQLNILSQQQQQNTMKNEIEINNNSIANIIVENNKSRSIKKEFETNFSTTNTTTKNSKTKNKQQQQQQGESLQPINMEDQEQAKLERKRLRNRIAASKCRQRKLERIQNLQEQVNEYNNRIKILEDFTTIIKDVNNQLLNQIQKHKDHGCDLNVIVR